MSSFWGTWIGFLRVSGGETSILVAEEEQLIGLELDEDDLVWNFFIITVFFVISAFNGIVRLRDTLFKLSVFPQNRSIKS